MNININFEVKGMTAAEARQASIIGAVQEEARQIDARRKFQEEVENAIKVIVTDILAEIAKDCGKGHSSCWYTLYPDDLGIRTSVANKAMPHVQNILTGLGYLVHGHSYSDQWYRKSGKYAYYCIKW